MAKTQFGKTWWWGEQWLNSLANIDYSNRLPRGATYARNSSIQSTVSTGENWIENLSNKEIRDIFTLG